MNTSALIRSLGLLTAALVAAPLSHADDARARENYLLHCMGCHGEAGTGLEGHVPSLRGLLARLAADPQGRRYVLGVPGVTQSSLDAQLLAEVLNWSVREFSEPPLAQRVKPFGSAEIAAARTKPLLEVADTRRKLTISE